MFHGLMNNHVLKLCLNYFHVLCVFFWVIPRRLNLRRRGITQKKTHYIQNTAKVWNQEYLHMIYGAADHFEMCKNSIRSWE